MNMQDSVTSFRRDKAYYESKGVYIPDALAYLPDEARHNLMAMDAQPALQTTPNSAIPWFLTNLIDPAVYEILFAPLKAADIITEQRKGDWTDTTAMFPTVEHTVETSAYGDYSENGIANANANWPQRQSFLFQVIKQYGDLEIARAGVGRLNWIGEIDGAAADGLMRFQNLTYFFGVGGLQCFGLLNDPNLSAPIAPAPKANGGTSWFTSDGHVNATANEVYNDIIALYQALVAANRGLVDKRSKLTLAMSPGSEVALTFTNTFNVNVEDLLKKNFPNLRVESAPQYEQLSASNPQGIAGGNFVQLIVDDIQRQKTAFCAYNEKNRAHSIVRGTSSYKQKVTAGTWGAIIRMPIGITSMIGV